MATAALGQALVRSGRLLITASAWPGRMAAWLLVPLALLVIATVVGSLFQMGSIASWNMDLPILGTGLTINSLNEMQWHLLAVLTMLALPYALAEGRHVRVDMLYAGFNPRRRLVVEVIGDILFLIPFCVVIGWLSIKFATFAYQTGEQSTYGGLTDRWVVKSFLTIGLCLLLVTGIGRVLLHIGQLLSSKEEVMHD